MRKMLPAMPAAPTRGTSTPSRQSVAAAATGSAGQPPLQLPLIPAVSTLQDFSTETGVTAPCLIAQDTAGRLLGPEERRARQCGTGPALHSPPLYLVAGRRSGRLSPTLRSGGRLVSGQD